MNKERAESKSGVRVRELCKREKHKEGKKEGSVHFSDGTKKQNGRKSPL